MAIATDTRLADLRKRAVRRLMEKRRALEKEAADLMASPASYGITGSVNVTNRDPNIIKNEIAEIDMQIEKLLAGGTPQGMALAYPDYRWRLGWR